MFHQAATELNAPYCLWLEIHATFVRHKMIVVGDYFLYLQSTVIALVYSTSSRTSDTTVCPLAVVPSGNWRCRS
jgi:hypothetical protein